MARAYTRREGENENPPHTPTLMTIAAVALLLSAARARNAQPTNGPNWTQPRRTIRITIACLVLILVLGIGSTSSATSFDEGFSGLVILVTAGSTLHRSNEDGTIQDSFALPDSLTSLTVHPDTGVAYGAAPISHLLWKSTNILSSNPTWTAVGDLGGEL